MTAPPPRFVVDRSLGKQTPWALRSRGWDVVLIQDVFPNEAQRVEDAEWLAWGNANADAALTKDKNIRTHPWYKVATIPIFCLARQDLPIDTMVEHYLRHEKRIHRVASSHPGRQFWMLYSTGAMDRIAG